MSIRDLDYSGHHWMKKIMPDDALHYVPPYGGGWGIARMVLQVPESILLMPAPPVCARIAALRQLRLEYRNRFFFLHIDEYDYINGDHLKKTEEAANEIIRSLNPAPKVLFLCETCIDDLVGSDFVRLRNKIETTHGIMVKSVHLKPTAADGMRHPGIISQRSIYELFDSGREKDSGINIIGSMVPVDEESELKTVLHHGGIGPVRHIASCRSYEEFINMGASLWNLLLRPPGRLAVEDMEKRLGIPFLSLPVSYTLERIDSNYTLLEEFLERRLKTEMYREEAADVIRSSRTNFRNCTAAVGGSVNAGSFELARALTEYGFDVKYVFSNMVIDFDIEHVEWLKINAPHIRVYTNSHTTMAEFFRLGKTVDLAFGFEAGYFCSGAPTVPLSADIQPFGYGAVKRLVNEIDAALNRKENHHQMMYTSLCKPGRPKYAGIV